MNNIILMSMIALLAFLPWFWRYQLRPRRAKVDLYQQLRGHPHVDRLIAIHSLLNTLYRNVPAQRTSSRERKRLGLNDDALTYGEIDFLSFLLILDRAQPQSGEIFYDLGSGTGRALLVAALSAELSKVIGVELLPGLCKLAQIQINKAKTLVQVSSERDKQLYLQSLDRIQVLNADFLQIDFSEADLIFINATCLSYYTWEKIVARLNKLKSGSRIIVTSKKIIHENFEGLYQGFELMSWGMNSVNIYRKR